MVALTLVLALGACDIPSTSPRWETRWVVPADEARIGVDEFLPAGVSPAPDGSAFSVSVDPVEFSQRLGDLCPACPPLDGLTVPKPAFQGSLQQTVQLPRDLVSVDVAQGVVIVEATNDLGFDPLRPGGGTAGTVVFTLHDGDPGDGDEIDRIVLDGASESFAPGSTIRKTLHLSGTIGATLVARVEVDSPAGDVVYIDDDQTLTASATLEHFLVASAEVRVAGREVRMDETALEMEDVDESVVDRVESGAFEFDVTNPWALGAELSLVIDGPTLGTPVTKQVTIPAAASSTVRVEFTGDDLRSFLGEPGVTVRGAATVASDAGSIVVAPGQELGFKPRLDLTVLMGGEPR